MSEFSPLFILNGSIFKAINECPRPLDKILWIFFPESQEHGSLNSNSPIWLGIKIKYLSSYSNDRIQFRSKVAFLEDPKKKSKHYSKNTSKIYSPYKMCECSFHVTLKTNPSNIILPGFDWDSFCPPKNKICTNKVNQTSFVDIRFGNDKTGKIQNPNCPFRTIQAAINSIPFDCSSSVGWLISVRPGKYIENIVISTNVSVEGAGTSLTIIEGTIWIIGQGGNQFSGLKILHRDFPALIVQPQNQTDEISIRQVNLLNLNEDILKLENYKVILLNRNDDSDPGIIRLEEINIQSNLTNFPSNDSQFVQLQTKNINCRLNDINFNIIGHPSFEHSFINSVNSQMQHHGGVAQFIVENPQKDNRLFQGTNALTHSQQDVRIVAKYLGENINSECIIYQSDANQEIEQGQMQVTNVTCDCQVPQENLTLAHSNAPNAVLNLLSGGFVGINRDVPKITGFTENIYYWMNSSRGSGTNKAGGYSNIVRYTELFGDSLSGTPELNQNTILMDLAGATLNLPLSSESILNGKVLTVKNISTTNVLVDGLINGLITLGPEESLTAQAKNLQLTSQQLNQTQVEWTATSVTPNQISRISPESKVVYQCSREYKYTVNNQLPTETYIWSLTSGDAQIVGPINEPTVTVDAGAENFSLKLEIRSEGPTTFSSFIQNVISPLSVTKQVNLIPTNISVGSQVEYAYTVRNSGNVIISNTEMVDSLIGPIRGCSNTSYSPETYLVCFDTYLITQEDIDKGEIVNTVNVTGTVSCFGEDLPLAAEDILKLSLAAPKLTLNKSGIFFQPQQAICYTYTIVNISNENLFNLTLTDNLEINTDDFGFDTFTPPNFSLSSGQTKVIQSIYEVQDFDIERGHVFNVANVESLANGVLVADFINVDV